MVRLDCNTARQKNNLQTSSQSHWHMKFFFHKRKTHIDAKYHFIRELVNNGEIVLQHCRSEEQFADIFTKPLARENFVYLIDCMGMVNDDSCD